MFEFGLILVGMFVLQGVLTYFQVKNYRINVSEISKKGNLFVGQIRGKLKAGSIVLMALDSNGVILDAKSMTGITVFHRFRSIDEIEGKNIYESEKWLHNIKDKQKIKAIQKGIEAMNSNIKDEVLDDITEKNLKVDGNRS